jgi:hypothetical protein
MLEFIGIQNTSIGQGNNSKHAATALYFGLCVNRHPSTMFPMDKRDDKISLISLNSSYHLP